MASTEKVYRSCPTCEASCGLVLEIDPAGQSIRAIKGDELDARSKGYVCAKSQAFAHIHDDPERLRRPMKRVGDEWVEVEWKEALDAVASRLAEVRDQHGKDAMALYYGNPNGHNFHTQIYTQMLIQMLDTERFFTAGSVDQQPKNLSCDLLYGNPWLFPVPDLSRTDYFVCMGGNPLVSQGSLLGAPNAAAYLEGIQSRGGKVVVIDPRRTETAEAADQHIFIRPGTDALFLFAWVNELFRRDLIAIGALEDRVEGLEDLERLAEPFTPEAVAARTGIDAQAMRNLVDDFANSDRPVLYGRIGLCTQAFGKLAYRRGEPAARPAGRGRRRHVRPARDRPERGHRSTLGTPTRPVALPCQGFSGVYEHAARLLHGRGTRVRGRGRDPRGVLCRRQSRAQCAKRQAD